MYENNIKKNTLQNESKRKSVNPDRNKTSMNSNMGFSFHDMRVIQRKPMEHICTHETLLYEYFDKELEPGVTKPSVKVADILCVSTHLVYDTDNSKKAAKYQLSDSGSYEPIDTDEYYSVSKIKDKIIQSSSPIYIKKSSLFSDIEQEWKVSFGSMTERESERQDIGMDHPVKSTQLPTVTVEEQKMLRKFELMRFQLQATYSKDDAIRLQRQTSPLAKEGYARGIRTGLYEENLELMDKLMREQKDEKFNASANKQIIHLGLSNECDNENKYKIYYILHGDIDTCIESAFNTVGRENKLIDQVKSKNEIIYFKDSKNKILFVKAGSTISFKENKTLDSLVSEGSIQLDDDKAKKWVESYTAKLVNQIKNKYFENLNKYKTFALRDLSCFANPSEIINVKDENELIDNLEKENAPDFIFFVPKYLFYMNKKKQIQAINHISYTIQKLDSYLGSAGMRLSPSQSAEQLANLSLSFGEDKKFSISAKKGQESKKIVPIGIDPHVQSTYESFTKLNRALNNLTVYDKSPIFAVKQNTTTLHRIAGINCSNLIYIDTLSRAEIPSHICAEFTDLLMDVFDISSTLTVFHDILVSQGEKEEAIIIKFSRQMELLYEKYQNIHHILRFLLDWNTHGEKATVDKSIRNIVGEHKSLQEVYTAGHGLAAMDKVRESMSVLITSPDKVAVFKGSYYETPDIFHGHSIAESVEEETLRQKEVIVFEPHPNNAAMECICENNPIKLFQTLFPESDKSVWPSKITVIIDITLNSLIDNEVKAIIETAQHYIKAGRLNLILLQSGTKFYQNGMDLVGIGTAAAFNNRESWEGFNTKMKEAPNMVPSDDNAYIGAMLDKNKDNLKSYIDTIKYNTKYLRAKLTELIKPEQDFYSLCINEDSSTVYIAIIPQLNDNQAEASSESELTAASNKISDVSIKKKSENELTRVNQNAYWNYLTKAFEKTSVVDRSSFGFNITNLGECIDTVRITLGIEPEYMLDYYAKIISDTSKQIYNKIKACDKW